jgi:hypothetical protein
MTLKETIDYARASYLRAHLLATDRDAATVAACKTYSHRRGMWRRVQADARRQAAGMDAAGYTAAKPYRVVGREIHGCGTCFIHGVGYLR